MRIVASSPEEAAQHAKSRGHVRSVANAFVTIDISNLGFSQLPRFQKMRQSIEALPPGVLYSFQMEHATIYTLYTSRNTSYTFEVPIYTPIEIST